MRLHQQQTARSYSRVPRRHLDGLHQLTGTSLRTASNWARRRVWYHVVDNLDVALDRLSRIENIWLRRKGPRARQSLTTTLQQFFAGLAHLGPKLSKSLVNVAAHVHMERPCRWMQSIKCCRRAGSFNDWKESVPLEKPSASGDWFVSIMTRPGLQQVLEC